MINHIRSALLNATCPGEFAEPMDAAFSPLQVDGSIMAAKRHLVPDKFPARTRNFLATNWQKMASQHPMYDLIQEIDSRELITSVRTPALLSGGLSVTNRGDLGATFLGAMTPTPQSGIFSSQWVVRKLDSLTVSVCDTATMNTDNFDITFNSDCSNRIVFGGGIFMRIMGVSSLPEIDVLVDAFAPFSLDLPTLLLKMRTTSGITGIFDLRKNQAIKTSLASDFLNSRRTDVALSAAIIACVLKMTEGSAI
jgi:hypothetical protein